jgi:hypothetical protein
MTVGDHGAKLWRTILSELDIADAPRLAILEQICAAYDRAESLRRVIDIEGELVVSDAGGHKANPLIMCELQARSLVARLMEGLRRSNEKQQRGPGRPSNAGL